MKKSYGEIEFLVKIQCLDQKIEMTMKNIAIPLIILTITSTASPASSYAAKTYRYHHKIYEIRNSSDIIANMGPLGPKTMVGRQIFMTAIYADNSFFSGSSYCGIMNKDKYNWDISSFVSGDTESVFNLGTIAACFPNSSTYERFGTGCPHSRVWGMPCHIAIAGTIRGKKKFGMKSIFGTWSYFDLNYVEVDRFRVLNYKSNIQKESDIQGLKKLWEMHDGLGNLKNIAGTLGPN